MASLGGNRPLGTAPPPPPAPLAGWAVALFLVARMLFLAVPFAIAFVIVTALLSGVIESERIRLAIAAGICVGLPLLLRWRVGAFLSSRKRKREAPSFGAFIAISNTLVAALLAFGFADDTGRALRRHGDWFLGERTGMVARTMRSGVSLAAAYFEKFDPQPELAPIILPPDPKNVPLGPWLPGQKPPEAEPTMVAWFHPLAGPRRAMPISEGRRFGAQRPPPRPSECELGHCGVDLGTTLGEPVFAIFDGVIEKIEREEDRGGRAGRYVRIGHRDGTVVSRYIHMDSIRNDLHEGDKVTGGQLLGRLGRTGVEHSGAHLHFGLSKRPGGRGGGEIYIDPEPYLRTWALVDGTKLLTATAMR